MDVSEGEIGRRGGAPCALVCVTVYVREDESHYLCHGPVEVPHFERDLDSKTAERIT